MSNPTATTQNKGGNEMAITYTYLDTGYTDMADPTERSEHDRYGLSLLTYGRADQAPITTADEFRRFVAAWHRNDPNGTWNPNGVVEGDGALIYEDEAGRNTWVAVGMSDDGAPLYALHGWTWVR